MTIDALAVLLCLVKPVFSHPQQWTPAECQEQAVAIHAAASAHDLDPVAIVATLVAECDLRTGIHRPIWTGVGKHRKQIGVDACPMGLRLYGHPFDVARWTDAALYMHAGAKMARWRKWCAAKHGGKHHWLSHYNPGNPVYSAQVLAFAAALRGREPSGESLTARTREIVRRLLMVTKRKEQRR